VEQGPADEERRHQRALLLLTLSGLLVRIAFLLLEPETHPIADERTWRDWAVEGLVTPRVGFSPVRIHLIFYPPLYPYFIALLYATFGTLEAVKWGQALLGTALIPAVGRIGARAFSPRVGTLAAAITALYPELVWFSAHFWSETLFMAFLWWALEGVLASDASGSWRRACMSGVLWGLAILTRETVFYFTPFAGLWLVSSRERSGKWKGAVFLVTAALTVAPWTYRNYVVFHAFVPVSTAGGLNLWQGNARFGREEVYRQYEAVPTAHDQLAHRIEQYRFSVGKGLEAIWERQPFWLFEKLRDEMPNFWEADSQALVHIKRGAYGPLRPAVAWGAALVVLLPYVAVLALFVGGLILPLHRPRLFLLGFLAYYNLIHVVTHGYARYRLPCLPVVFLFAAAAVVALKERRFPAFDPSRWLLAAVVALVLLLSLIPSVEINLQDPVFGLGTKALPQDEAPAP
jgi:4-amino-4-deoxy-L-arabinose transferase-like glycosyltransferase